MAYAEHHNHRIRTIKKRKAKVESVEAKLEESAIEKVSLLFQAKKAVATSRRLESELSLKEKKYFETAQRVERLQAIYDKASLNNKASRLKIEELQIELRSLQKSYDYFAQECQILEKINKQIEDNYTNQLVQKNELKRQNQLLEKDLVSLQSTNEAFESKIKNIVESIEQLKFDNESKTKLIEDTSNTVSELRGVHQSKSILLKKLKDRNEDLKAQLEQRENDLEDLRFQIEDQTKEIANCNYENNEFKRKLTSCSQENSKLREELEQLKEMQMLTSLTLDHVNKEYENQKRVGLKLKAHIEKNTKRLTLVSQALDNKRKNLLNIQAQLKSKGNFNTQLLELIERTQYVLERNKEFIENEFDKQATAKIPNLPDM